MTHLYVCEFSNGTIKVGRSIDPKGRVETHAMRVACVGVSLIRSDEFVCVGSDSRAESDLIRRCTAEAVSVRGNEWFEGLDYAVVCEWASVSASTPDIAVVPNTKNPILLLAIEACGGRAKFQRSLNITAQVTWNWLNRENCPPIEMCPFIERAADDPRVTCETLRPDYEGWAILRGRRLESVE